jgi:hypothetical protein
VHAGPCILISLIVVADGTIACSPLRLKALRYDSVIWSATAANVGIDSSDLEWRRAGCIYAAGNEALPRKDNGVDHINNVGRRQQESSKDR